MNRIETLHSNIFSQKNVELFEKNIMFLAVGGFILHLLLIFFENYYAVEIFSAKQIYQVIPYPPYIHHSPSFLFMKHFC